MGKKLLKENACMCVHAYTSTRYDNMQDIIKHCLECTMHKFYDY